MDTRLSHSEVSAMYDFQRAMQHELEENAHKGTWQDGFSAWSAFCRILEEARELEDILRPAGRAYSESDVQRIVSEAADVANFAMMVADIVGGLKRE